MTEREAFEYKTKHPEQTDFKLLFFRYTRYWYLFVLGVILTVSLAVLYLIFTTPQYLVSTSIKIRGVNKDPDYQAGAPGFRRLDAFDAEINLLDEIEALQSVSLMERMIDELNLTTTYYADAGFGESELYGEVLPVRAVVNKLSEAAFSKEISIRIVDPNSFILTDELEQATEHRFGKEIRTPYGIFTVVATPALAAWDKDKEIEIHFSSVSNLATYYLEQISVVQVGEESSVLYISMLHPIPEKGRDILNKLVELYNREAKEDRNRLAQNTLEFIDARLRDVTAELTEVESEVEQFRRENQVTEPRADAAASLEESRVYNRQLSELNIQIDVLESLDKYLSQPRERYELVPSNLDIDSPTLLDLIQRFNELQLERERKLRNVEPNNPLLQNINVQIETLRQSILENLQVIRRGIVVQRESVAQKAGSFRSRLEQSPGIERELNEINRRLGVMQDLYTFLLQKREESALSLASTTSNIRVIDPAIASKAPVVPNKPVVILMALVLGLVLPFAGIFAKDFLDNSIKLKNEVEQLTTSPVIGEVPHVSKRKNWVALHQYGTPFAEQVGLIISNIYVELPGAGSKVLLFTSGKNREGKTFLSKNLALSLCQAGNKVILLELDLRKPSLLKDLGLNYRSGITDYLTTEKISVDDITMASDVAPGLFVAGSGPIPPNPAVVFSSPKLKELMAELRQRFDFILIDTAPAGQAADAYALSPFADLTIYTIRYNYTLKAEVSTIDSVYVKKKLKQPVIVLNDARKMNSRSVR